MSSCDSIAPLNRHFKLPFLTWTLEMTIDETTRVKTNINYKPKALFPSEGKGHDEITSRWFRELPGSIFSLHSEVKFLSTMRAIVFGRLAIITQRLLVTRSVHRHHHHHHHHRRRRRGRHLHHHHRRRQRHVFVFMSSCFHSFNLTLLYSILYCCI